MIKESVVDSTYGLPVERGGVGKREWEDGKGDG